MIPRRCRSVAAGESINAVLREYKNPSAWSSDDHAHLQRWMDDHRAEQVWDRIQCAARSKNVRFPARIFITDILAARRIAIGTGQRGKLRGMLSKRGRRNGAGCQVFAQTAPLRHAWLPKKLTLARMLDGAANYIRSPGDTKHDRCAE